MTAVATAWPLADGLYRSPGLTELGLVAGFTTRAEGSLAGSVFPQAEQDLWSYRSRGERGPQGTALAVLGWPH